MHAARHQLIGSGQTVIGIRVGIEDFWVACIAQYGLIVTIVLTVGLACFFVEILRRSHPAAHALTLYLVVMAAGSITFSAKGVTLAQYVILMLLLLPRDRVARNAVMARADGAAIASLAAKAAADLGVIKDGWNGYCVLHSAASRVGALDLGFVPGDGTEMTGDLELMQMRLLDRGG